jgi:hypothetical protein
MNEPTSLELSRRLFIQAGSAALAATAIGCNPQPAPEPAKAPGNEGAGTTPTANAKEVKGTAPNTLFSKEYVQMVGRFAYFWGWPMVNSFNRRTATASVPEPGLRGGILPNAPMGQVCMLTDYISPDQRFVTCSNQDVAYGLALGRWMTNRWLSRYRILVTGSGWLPGGMQELTRLRNSGSSTGPNPVSISLPGRTGTERRPTESAEHSDPQPSWGPSARVSFSMTRMQTGRRSSRY